MTRERKITRHTIESGEPQAFHFLGVVSAEPDYRLSVMINRHLGSTLRKSEEEIIVNGPAGSGIFSKFIPRDQAFTLVSNRSGGNLLLRKLKNIDFLVLPGGNHTRNEAEELAAELRKIPEITAVFILDSREVSDRNLSLLAL
ncbi:MAG: IPExxxVDY family protein [Bacteroidales bacterium]|jgi:hypothetical protein|nr:IPExxxVDY family protein [Bacteroidales bacterium]